MRAAGAVHELRCHQRLSYELVRERLAEDHGINRSIGSIVAYLHRWRCEYCREEAASG
jgi:hypothetical protein